MTNLPLIWQVSKRQKNGFNTHSLAVDPQWNKGDLRTYVPELNNAAIDLTGIAPYVKFDIDRNPRPNAKDGKGNVDIGANDFFDYCPPAADSSNARYGISNVKLANLNSTSILNNGGYKFFYDRVIELEQGNGYQIEIEKIRGTDKVYRQVWADWNADGDFLDADEWLINDSSTTATSWKDSIKVPLGANLGQNSFTRFHF